ncbi:hypothetical protein AGDE_00425 [Angomonas deanei]|uniref:Uncharacterized protein n=1 Tax=Angomonas deanei TaxID=59799 RepID=A0A7G2CW16_9TRYP|nr:hypothetical protein AGDE_00425 [Angomonas deanei]CAD2222623.1 hypothetical protein, conserved [Angomonas deanei]|eukprot:EPY43496.1 hypothetical protein AGDE_00425 [Angomonas deanei]
MGLRLVPYLASKLQITVPSSSLTGRAILFRFRSSVCCWMSSSSSNFRRLPLRTRFFFSRRCALVAEGSSVSPNRVKIVPRCDCLQNISVSGRYSVRRGRWRGRGRSDVSSIGFLPILVMGIFFLTFPLGVTLSRPMMMEG